MFALIPPAGMGGGWPCFFVALAMIGLLTAIVGDLVSGAFKGNICMYVSGFFVQCWRNFIAVSLRVFFFSVNAFLEMCPRKKAKHDSKWNKSNNVYSILVISQQAGIFGCLVGLKDSVTAITFVALGTSLPDTFASRAAAVGEKHADNAIGNVTGSNSVNVFLGLGLPWVIAAIYWAAKVRR